MNKLNPTVRDESENDSTQPGKILNSWKEIASYIGRGVRTVQRYEVQFGFPARRPAGTSRSSVLAFTDEVDAWLRRAPARRRDPAGAGVIEMPANTASDLNGTTDGAACPFCHGTGRANAEAKSLNKDGGLLQFRDSQNDRFRVPVRSDRRQSPSN